MTLSVRGSYGRTYKSAVFARRDWFSNKDFQIINAGGRPYINKADADNKNFKSPYPIKIYINPAVCHDFTVINQGETK